MNIQLSQQISGVAVSLTTIISSTVRSWIQQWKKLYEN